MTAYNATDLVERPSRVAQWSTQDKTPIAFTGTYVDGATLPAGTHTVAYGGATLTAANGSGTGYVFTNITDLPPGLVMSTGGVISGTPLYAGAWTILVTVADSVGNQVSAKLYLTVA